MSILTKEKEVSWVVDSARAAMVIRFSSSKGDEITVLEPVHGVDDRSIAYDVTIGDAGCRLERWSCEAKDRTVEEAIIIALKAAGLY